MEESTTKEKVLKRIRNALISKTPGPFTHTDMGGEVYEPLSEALDVAFAEELTRVGGKFIYCESNDEMLSTLALLIEANNLQPVFCNHQAMFDVLAGAEIPVENDIELLPDVRAALTGCEFLIARTGSVMVSSQSGPGRKMNILPDVHIVLAHTKQLVPDIKPAFKAIKEKYQGRLPSMINLITGPSRTADIEKTLVMGAHGPRELYVFLIDDKKS